MACKNKNGKSMVLYGVTSWGIGCGSKLPGYYVRVGNYVQWIRGIMGKDICRRHARRTSCLISPAPILAVTSEIRWSASKIKMHKLKLDL